jgi:alkylation response protein AidB-like acyl-CoA dehydrogenase
MITAKEARELAGPTIEEMAEFFDKPIREAAAKKERSVTVYHGILEDEAYSNTTQWNEFVAYMAKLGFVAELYYSEYQFVDMRITIKW